MPRIIEKVINPIVGLSAEAIAHHRNKSKSRSPSPNSQPQPSSSSPGFSAHPENAAPDYESDEEAWELDDASEDVAQSQGSDFSVPKGTWASPASVNAIADAFLSRHKPGDRSLGASLEMPVVIPQKRPHTKFRGFVRAYAPLLEECGIGQDTWVEFMGCFHESMKVSPAFDVVNGAVAVVGMVGNAFPSVTIQVTTTAVQAADMIAKEAYTRNRTNTFLATLNSRYFAPQGLYCLLMTWQPSSANVVSTVDLTTTVAKATAASDDAAADASFQQKLKSQFKLLKGSHGLTQGDAEIPAAAPLIYPQLDRATDEQKQSWFSRGKAFAADYFDRRATAQYLADNPRSTIGSVSQAPRFESSKGDPNATPKNAGLKTALGGGEGRLGARLRERRNARAEKMEWRRQNPKLVGTAANALTRGNRPKDVVRRVLHPDVIYLLVVRLPSEEEMSAATKALEKRQ